MAKLERRFFAGLEIREGEGDKKDGRIATLTGYAAVFNQLSEDLGGFREFIRAGAFKDSLTRGDDIRALVDHDSGRIIGRRSAKTLEIREDDKGLLVDIAVPDTSSGRDVVVSVKRGDLTGMSFGFATKKDEWRKEKLDNGDIVRRRELVAVDLFEVSAVAFPAYPQTAVEARDCRSAKEVLEEGIKRLGTDAPADPALETTRRTIALYQARRALWTAS